MIRKTVQKAVDFLRDVQIEAKKVSYPSREETISTTVVVLVLVFLVALYLWVVDLALSRLIGALLP